MDRLEQGALPRVALDATEITRHFSGESNRQLILAPARPSIYMERLNRDA